MIFILLCYPPAQLDRPQRSNRARPTLLTGRASSPFLPPASRARVFGWLLCLTGGHLRPRRFFNFFISFSSPPGMKRPPPLHVQPRSVSSPTPLPLLMPTFGWLLCLPIKGRPSKAKGPPISLLVFVHQLTTKAMMRCPPARSSPVPSPLRCPPYCRH